MGNEYHIPWAKPEFWGDEEPYLREALRSAWISGGPFVDRFESEFARYNSVKCALATSNGTTAIHLAYLGIGIQPGDEVIVPGFAFMAAANVALHMHAAPVFADVDPQTWCMTAEQVEARLSPRTKAIVPVHTYGNVCAMDEILDVARKRGIPVIEDAAEAFASSYKGRMAGTFGELGTYSTHATKTITTGEGGLVVLNDERLAGIMRLYRSHGTGPRRYWHEVPGHNFRMTNLQAALGCAQLLHIERIIAERQRMYSTYQRLLLEIPGLAMQHFASYVHPVVWVVAVTLDARAFPQGRDAVMQQMKAAGIETRPGFYTPTDMRHLYSSPPLPIAEGVSKSVVALPSFPTLSDEQIGVICSELNRLRR